MVSKLFSGWFSFHSHITSNGNLQSGHHKADKISLTLKVRLKKRLEFSMSRIARERDHIADVFHTCSELDEPFKAGAKACMRH